MLHVEHGQNHHANTSKKQKFLVTLPTTQKEIVLAKHWIGHGVHRGQTACHSTPKANFSVLTFSQSEKQGVVLVLANHCISAVISAEDVREKSTHIHELISGQTRFLVASNGS